jgi:hypothetical protein
MRSSANKHSNTLKDEVLSLNLSVTHKGKVLELRNNDRYLHSFYLEQLNNLKAWEKCVRVFPIDCSYYLEVSIRDTFYIIDVAKRRSHEYLRRVYLNIPTESSFRRLKKGSLLAKVCKEWGGLDYKIEQKERYLEGLLERGGSPDSIELARLNLAFFKEKEAKAIEFYRSYMSDKGFPKKYSKNYNFDDYLEDLENVRRYYTQWVREDIFFTKKSVKNMRRFEKREGLNNFFNSH